MTIDFGIYWLLGAIVFLNLATSTLLIRAQIYTSKQVAMQIAFIWLLPLLGGLIIACVLWSVRQSPKGSTSNIENQTDSASTMGHGDYGNH